MESQDRSRSPSRRTSRVEQVVGRWLRRSRDLGSRSHSLSRDRAAADGKTGESGGSDQRNYPFRFNVQIQKDPDLNSHGLTLSSQIPILVQEVTTGGPADGRLVPGDQLVKINNVAVDDLTPEQAAEIIRECQDTLTMTVLRILHGPKSSFITPEKRAKLRSNPVKVHFAEEVEVNGQSQGNSLLFLPNVLKVYLENGQTKAFKFETSTTVKDIVMTLKEKLSLNRIEHFSLVLEQQHNSSKLLLLHEEERIHQVVQKKEVHNYRCLFRVCFMPKDFKTLLQEDPTAFEYLYLQGVNDVLQERYAVEMRCNTALRLAALHIQERLVSCGLSPKANLKMITSKSSVLVSDDEIAFFHVFVTPCLDCGKLQKEKTWGIENFVSSTLLRNMREKDLRKAIGFHMKKTQSQHDPKQKSLSVDQARINYLEELSDLKSFGGKSFGATLMLQDRESMVSLLVGARYGVSQVVNHKLSIMTTLTEFNSITRVELLPESDKVSLVKIYLQDIKPITLLLEAGAAKDMSCLIAGYCRVFIDPNLNVFPWIDDKKHRVSAEEGYVSRCASDSEDSSDLNMEPLYSVASQDDKPRPRVRSLSDSEGRKRKDRDRMRSKDCKGKGDAPVENKKPKQEKYLDTPRESASLGNGKEEKNDDTSNKKKLGAQIQIQITGNDSGAHKVSPGAGEEEQPSTSEASDSCHTDSHVLTSPSSDSLDALEEDDLISCASSSVQTQALSQPHVCVHSPFQLHLHSDGHVQPHLLTPPPPHAHPLIHLTVVSCAGESGERGGGCRRSGDGADPKLMSTPSPSPKGQKHSGELCSADSSLCFAELSRLADLLPSPPEASEDDDVEDDELRRKGKLQSNISVTLRNADEGGSAGEHPFSASPSSPSSHKDFVFNFDQSDARCYYNLCSNITPDSARSLPGPQHPNIHKDEAKADGSEPIPILQPPPGFGDSSSDEEFFDARDRFTSPEDPTSGAVRRGSQTEMKLDTLSILSLSDIRVSVMDTEMDKQEDQEERESKDSTFLLRKKSRKRRSFMETDYTSRVTYPETDIESESNLNPYRFLKNILTGPNDNPILTLDPQPSGLTQNPSPTIFSLTHSEGEPAQLESKPILSKLCSHDPGFLSASEKNRNLNPPSRTRKQEMEMEPDAMESKSVTDLVKVVPPTITVVRCRVDPDGKESADRRGDGKEEGEDQEEIGEEKEAEKENPVGLTGNGPLTSHTFLPDTIEEHGKEEKKENVFDVSSSLKRPLVGAEITQGAIIMSHSFTEVNERLVTAHMNKHVDKNFLSLISPPPPPPSPLLPQTPPALKPEMEPLIKEAETSKNITSINNTAVAPKEQSNNHSGSAKLLKQALISANDEELIHESTENSNSDNVFDDEDDADASNSLSYSSGKKQKDRTVSANSFLGDYLTQGTKDETHISAQLLLNLEVQNRDHSVNADHILAIKSIRAKLGAATSIISSLNSGTALKNTVTPKPKSDSTLMSSEPAESLGSPGIVMAKAATLNDLSKELPPPSRFILQTCSPSIMDRLSASTLRGKIQNLPLYLSRSQESLNKAGVGSSAPSPAGEASSDIACTTDNVPDITQTLDLETCTAPDSAESDDSDATLTGSELDGEFFVETTTAKRSPLASEKKEVSCQLPVQTEPKQHNQTLCSRSNDNTPGPITEPPASITSLFQRNTSGLNTNTPGPVTDAPELNIKVNSLQEDIPGYKGSSQSPIVVTTQNLNGPRLAFHGQSQKARTSSDRPLMGLCSPLEQTSDPSKVSAGCRVFTICEDLSQTSTPADLVATTPLKSEFGCSSILASGCESLAEGVQVPLDACGCPASYTNCFSGEDSFDDELTVYEFSCRSQSTGISQTSRAGLHLITSPPVPSFIPASSTVSPSFPQTILFSSSSTSELSPLLSPHSDTSESYLSETHKDTLTHLGQQHYPEPPKGFQVLRRDVDKLLSILEGSGGSDRSAAGLGGRHARDTCPAHFTENKRVLQLEARRLMSSCQKVTGTGQSPEEMLRFLADSFRTLVELATVCLWFSGCERCDRRNAEAVAGLADVARSFRDFCLAAERASSKRSCQDLSTKLLAKQCTALTASVFCLTQLFRTLTAL